MGAADLVPGISGGTVALLTGIYDTLITSLAGLFQARHLKQLLKFQWKTIFQETNILFLIILELGILTSVFSLARVIEYMLISHSIVTWSFFFSVIFCSIILLMLKNFKPSRLSLLQFSMGFVIAFSIAFVSPAQSQETGSLLSIVGAGSIAISAMLIPGISGSYLLVLMGKYASIINALKTFDILVISMFTLGSALGLIFFSKILNYFLKHHYHSLIAIMSGFMLGALPKAWPWKTLSKSGKDLYWLPATYESLTGEESKLLLSLFVMIGASLFIASLEIFSRRQQKKASA